MFEKLAERLNELWGKPYLTRDERREADLILNNAMIIDEMRRGVPFTPNKLPGTDEYVSFYEHVGKIGPGKIYRRTRRRK